MRSTGVASEVNLRNPLCAVHNKDMQEMDTGFDTHGRRHQKSKIGPLMVRIKMTNVLHIFLKKKIRQLIVV